MASFGGHQAAKRARLPLEMSLLSVMYKTKNDISTSRYYRIHLILGRAIRQKNGKRRYLGSNAKLVILVQNGERGELNAWPIASTDVISMHVGQATSCERDWSSAGDIPESR